jgi:hypothetical protein
MKLNAARDIRAEAWPGNGTRVQIRIGVFRFTAMPDEAVELARQLVDAADAIEREGERCR